MLDSASSLITPRPKHSQASSHPHDAILPLTILISHGGKQLRDVELPSALSLSIATTRCPSTASSITSSPRDCTSAYADLFSPPSAAGPLSPLELPATSFSADVTKRAASAVCRSLHFNDSWLTRAAVVESKQSTPPPASAVLPAVGGKRHNRRDKAKRRSRSAQRHPHSQQQQPADDIDSPADPPAPLATYSSTAELAGLGRWEQLYSGEAASGSDDDWDGGASVRDGLERADISRAFLFSDLY